jgi:hypothetical protein
VLTATWVTVTNAAPPPFSSAPTPNLKTLVSGEARRRQGAPRSITGTATVCVLGTSADPSSNDGMPSPGALVQPQHPQAGVVTLAGLLRCGRRWALRARTRPADDLPSLVDRPRQQDGGQGDRLERGDHRRRAARAGRSEDHDDGDRHLRTSGLTLTGAASATGAVVSSRLRVIPHPPGGGRATPRCSAGGGP